MTSFMANRSSLRDWRPIPLLPRLTAFLVIATASRSSSRLIFGLVVALIVFGSDRAARNGWFWIGVGVVMSAWNLADWVTVDDHIVLAGYWYLGLGAALLSDHPEKAMAASARLLLGLVFAIAVLRKAANPEFVNGDFFVFTLLVDPRFEGAASAIGGVSDTVANQVAVGQLPNAVVLVGASGIRPLALALTWGAFLVESSVAATHLLPARKWRKAGQVALIAFIVATYLVVPVVGFGAGLIVMGAASATTDAGRRRWAMGFLALAVWGYLWQGYSL